MIFMGIDPGASGGWAIVAEDGYLVRHDRLRDGDGKQQKEKLTAWDRFVANLSSPAQFDLILLEKVWATPQMGVTSAFSFGMNFGRICGTLDALKRPYREITSMAWQRQMGLIMSGRQIGQNDDKKARNKAAAQAMHPGETITHATADAILIAECARRLWLERTGQ